ncbi:MAG: hypothetical protein ACRCVX_01135 [Shewanella sp.]
MRNKKKMNLSHFFAERPALNLESLAIELLLDPANLRKIAAGKRNVPQHKRGQFDRVLKRYGYQPPSNQVLDDLLENPIE